MNLESTIFPRIGDFAEPVIEVPPEEKNVFYYFIITLYLTVLLLSFVINTALISILLKTRKRPFFILLCQLILANLFFVLSNLVCSLPVVTILECDDVEDFTKTSLYTVFNNLDRLAEQLIYFISLLIAVQRFFVFIAPRLADFLFTGCIFLLQTLLSWALSLSVAFFLAIFNCSFMYMDSATANLQRFVYNCNFSEKSYIFHVQRISTGLSVYIYSTQLNSGMVFLARRISSTANLAAGAVGPLFVILFSKDVRQATGKCIGFTRAPPQMATSPSSMRATHST